jgi:hypothetical protein
MLDYLENVMSLEEQGDALATKEAWARVFEYMRHIGIELEPSSKLGDASASDLVLAQYRKSKGFDCEQAVLDYLSFPPIVERIRELKAQQRAQAEARARQKRESRARRKRRHGEQGGLALATRCHKI